jgi:O-antigen ligase
LGAEVSGVGVCIPKRYLLAIGAIVGGSVLLGSAWAMSWMTLLAGLGGVSLFVAMVWDIRIVLPLLIVLFPLGPRFPFSFGNLYLSTAVLVIVYAAWLWRNALAREPYAIYLNRVVVAIAVFLGVLLVSSIQNLAQLVANKSNLLRFVQLFLYASLLALVLAQPLSRRAIKMLMALVLVAGLIEGLVGLVRWRSSTGLFVHGTFEGGHSDFAVYAIMIATLLMGVLLEARSLALSIASLAALGVMVTAIIFSFSRGGYAALAVSFLCLLAMPTRRRRKAAMASVFLAGVMLFFLFGPVHLFNSLKALVMTLTARAFPISFVYRLGMWKTALADFLEHPILGRGTWSYDLRDNFYMKVLGEAGIVGLAAFIGLLVTILREEWRAIRSCPDGGLMRGVAIGLLPATVGCLVVFELSGDFFVVHRFTGSFWVVLALTLKYCLGLGVEGSQLEKHTA